MTAILANGMRIAVERDGAGPPAYFVRYDVGTRDEPADRSGLAHLVEHLMWENGRDGGLHAFLAGLGGFGNATTYLDWTGYFAVLPLEGLEPALEMEAFRMRELPATEADLEREKRIIAAESAVRLAERDFVEEELSRAAAFARGDPYGRSCLGSAEGLEAATLREARRWHGEHYGPARAILAVTGMVDARSVLATVEGAFATIEARKRPVRAEAGHPNAPVAGQTGGGRAVMAWRGPPDGDRGCDALDLAGGVLAAGRACRLGRAGFDGWSFTLHRYAEASLAVLALEGEGDLDALFCDPPDEAEVTRARELERLGDARQHEDSGERAELVAHAYAAGRSQGRLAARWDACTTLDVTEAWQLLSGDPLVRFHLAA
ncbi:MAG: pitrilysin family protein [Acidimicrobiia bacterium]